MYDVNISRFKNYLHLDNMSLGRRLTFSVHGTVSFVSGTKAMLRMRKTFFDRESFCKTQVNPAVS
jgi:hypothetical protein